MQVLIWAGIPGNSEIPDPIRQHAESLGVRAHVSVGKGNGRHLDESTAEIHTDAIIDFVANEIQKHYEIPHIFDFDGPIEVDFEKTRWIMEDNGPIPAVEYLRRTRDLIDALRRSFLYALPFMYAAPFYPWPGYELPPGRKEAAMELAANCLCAHTALYLRLAWLGDGDVTIEWVRDRVAYRMENIAKVRRPTFVHVSPWAWNAPGWFVKPITDEQWQACLDAILKYQPAFLCLWQNFSSGRWLARINDGEWHQEQHDEYTNERLGQLVEAVKQAEER